MKFSEFKNSVYESAKNTPIILVLVKELIRRKLFKTYREYLNDESNVPLIFEKLKQEWDENMVVGPWPPV